MGKSLSGLWRGLLGTACLVSICCGGGRTTRVVPNQVPASVFLFPGPNVSLELGKRQLFVAGARNAQNRPIPETFSFQSTNPSVLTIANNGIACGGGWDSLVSPLVCTPGSAGTAEVTAVALGVSSPPVTVYVHQTITSISISQVPGQTPTLSPLCLSKGAPAGPESWLFQASAFNGTTDITSAVGPFTWQTVNPATASIVNLSSPSSPAILNQQLATANVPGLGQIFASASGFNSNPVSVLTCPVQSISLAAVGNPGNSFLVNVGTATTLNATVKDTLGMTVTGVPLAWSSSNPASVGATGGTSSIHGSLGTATASGAGAASVIASCTPPACNGGIKPSQPVYPQAAMSFEVTNPSAPPNPTAYATTMACADPIANPNNSSCTAAIVSIGKSNSGFTAGIPLALPSTPNSFLYDPAGSSAYLGVDSGRFGQAGLMVFNGSAVSPFLGVPGKVLAISPDRTMAVVSDTVDQPNEVFIFNAASRTATPLLVSGATAAAFSADSLKAYIAAGANLYVYSRLDPLETIPPCSPMSGPRCLGVPTTDVQFIGEGALGYIAGGDPAGATFLPTCDDPRNPQPLPSLSLPSQMLRALPDGQSILALAPPNIQSATAAITGPAPAPVNVPGCPAPVGFLAIQTTLNPPVNLGLGAFTPTEFFISPDGKSAYILAEVQQSAGVSVASAIASGSDVTYTYTLTSGPAPEVGMNLAISGMSDPGNNGTFRVIAASLAGPSGTGSFTVTNPSGVTSTTAQSGSATGSEILKLAFVVVFNLTTQTTSLVSLSDGAVPLSASVAPAGDFLYVGADDGAVHVIDTSSGADIAQVVFSFPASELCFGPGNPSTNLESVLDLTAASQSGANTSFSYTLTSGPPLEAATIVKIRGMADPTNNGSFLIASLGTGAFTVINPVGVTRSGQTGTGTAGIICNPDLVAAKP